MLASQNFIAHLNNQLVLLIVQPTTLLVDDGGGFFQDGVSTDHLSRNQIRANAEVLQRTLGLQAPKFVHWNLDRAEAVMFCANCG